MKKGGVWLCLFTVVLAAAVIMSWGYLKGNLDLGLDLRGGAEVVLQAVPEAGKSVTTEDMQALKEIMRKRVDNIGVSEPIIQLEGDDRIIEQVTKQLHKIVEVLKIKDVTHDEHVGRELLMLRVLANKEDRLEIMHLCEIFRIKIVDINKKSFIIEATGTHSKLDAIEQAFRPFGLLEMSRTGTIAMVRGDNKAAKRE